jgi:hypothetical protein
MIVSFFAVVATCCYHPCEVSLSLLCLFFFILPSRPSPIYLLMFIFTSAHWLDAGHTYHLETLHFASAIMITIHVHGSPFFLLSLFPPTLLSRDTVYVQTYLRFAIHHFLISIQYTLTLRSKPMNCTSSLFFSLLLLTNL